MKRLVDKLRESLLDNEEELSKNSDIIIYNKDLNNYKSNFRQSYKIVDLRTDKPCEGEICYYDKDAININYEYVVHVDDKCISDFYNVNKLRVAGVLEIENGYDLLCSDNLADKVECCSFISSHANVFKNLNLTISDKLKFDNDYYVRVLRPSCNFSGSGKCKEFNNIYIKFDSNYSKRIIITSQGVPKFNNFRSNCETIDIQHNDMFKYADKSLNDLFIFPYNTTLKEYGIERDVTIKNLKMLMSMIVSRKYRWCPGYNIFGLKETKLKDIIDISKCPYLECLKLTDGVNCIQFDRGNKKKYRKGNILDWDRDIYTSDGWRVSVYKITFGR